MRTSLPMSATCGLAGPLHLGSKFATSGRSSLPDVLKPRCCCIEALARHARLTAPCGCSSLARGPSPSAYSSSKLDLYTSGRSPLPDALKPRCCCIEALARHARLTAPCGCSSLARGPSPSAYSSSKLDLYTSGRSPLPDALKPRCCCIEALARHARFEPATFGSGGPLHSCKFAGRSADFGSVCPVRVPNLDARVRNRQGWVWFIWSCGSEPVVLAHYDT